MNEQNQPIENSTEKQPVVAGMSRIKIFVGLGVLALGVLGTAGFGVYRAYAQSASDAFTVAVAKALHLPAIKLQDKKILYTDYIEDLKAIRVMKEYDTAQRAAGESEQRTPGADITEEQMTDQVLWRLVNNSLVEAAAEKYAVTVSDEDVAGLKSGMLQNFKDETELELELLKRYGWNLGDYERKVIRPFILQSKLAKKITEDADAKELLRVQAQKVLDEVKNGGDFAELAKQYSADGSAQNGGDLGWFSKGKMVEAFEKAAFSLKKGETYPTLVETDFGYHIIKLDDRRVEKVKNDKGVTENQEQVRASHILFKFTDLGGYIEDAIKSAKPTIYLKVHNPFAEEAQEVQKK